MKKINEWFFLKDSWKDWNTTTIMVWVHGNEYSWIDALDEIIDNIDVVNWKVYFIYANLEAIKQNVRFTERNLNRCFIKWINAETYEEKRAIEIMNILDKSDYLLDVHNTTSYNSSLEVLITTNIEFSKYFDIKNVVTHIDDIQKWWSDWYMDSIWKKWFCLECWSINFWDKEKSNILAKNSIINFLKANWNIKGNPVLYDNKKEIVKMDFMYKTKTNDFNLKKQFRDFEELKSWDIVWYDWKEKLIVDTDSIILFAHNRKEVGKEWFCIWHKI